MIYAIMTALVVLTSLAGAYLWKRLVWDTTRSVRARIVGSIAAALLGLLIPVTMGAETVPWVAWPGFIWLAFVLYLSLILLAWKPRCCWRSSGCAAARVAWRGRRPISPTG